MGHQVTFISRDWLSVDIILHQSFISSSAMMSGSRSTAETTYCVIYGGGMMVN